MIALLAQFPMPPVGDVGNWVWGLLGALGAGILVMIFIRELKGLLGRKPPLDETLAKLRADLSGLAPSDQVARLVEQLAGAATKAEVAAVSASLSALLDKEIREHKDHVENQLTEMHAYLRAGVHDLRETMQAGQLSAENGREGVHARINTLVAVTYELRGLMRGIKLEVES